MCFSRCYIQKRNGSVFNMINTNPLFDRHPDRPFDPVEELTALPPLSRMTYPDGHEGWVATSHAVVRAVLADPRFSARSELVHVPYPTADDSKPAAPGIFPSMDPPNHTRYRRLLTGQFTVRRMRLLEQHIHKITTERLNAMAPPSDLVTALAQPVTAQVICELLGVPFADRARFMADALAMFRLGAETEKAFASVFAYVDELVQAKRAAPGDDMLANLTGTDLTDEELVNIGVSLLVAGLDTTANMITLGAFALLRHPEQLAALRAEPEAAVEELLRYLSVAPGTVRSALEDVELAGQVIRAGESVTVSIPAANRDPGHFADPDTLDLRRSSAGHVAFGHGVHQCLGQQLARVELRVVLPALFNRFPTLRLAVPAEEIPLRTDMLIYGVHRLPVTWDR
jgi:cytochrome P450